MTTPHYSTAPEAPLEIRVFTPMRLTHATADSDDLVKFIETTDNLPHLQTDPDPLVREYMALRERRYVDDHVPYNRETQRFFDELPNTRIVLAIQDGKLKGGGRIIRKCPGDNFNLSFELGSFNQQVLELLDKANMTPDQTNIIDVGGVVAKESDVSDTFAGIGRMVQRKIVSLANEYPYINISTVAARNARSVAVTIRNSEGMQSIIYPERTLGDAKIHLFINTNIDAVAKAMQETISEGNAVSPLQFLRYKSAGPWPAENDPRFSEDAIRRRNSGGWKRGGS